MATDDRGLVQKYRVERIDGQERGPYFVLDYRHDPHAATALLAYAASVENEHPVLARDLRSAVRDARPIASGRPSYLKEQP